MNSKLKHLEIVQGVINRMAANSFHLKGWSVVLVSALFALAAKDANARFVALAYFPAIMLWVLDAYFLWQERLFRRLYDGVRGKPESEIDFSMNTGPYGDTESWSGAAFSKTLLIFHGAIIVTIIIVMIALSQSPTNGT